MNHFLSFDEVESAELVGNKFFYLSRISRISKDFSVPKAICMTTNVFSEILSQECIDWLKRFFEDLRATVGCYLVDSIKELDDMIKNLTLDSSIRKALTDKMESVFGEEYIIKSYAIRSSCVSEDSVHNSFAGVYHSELNVRGFEEICNSILLVMRHYYSYSSVASRIRSNNYDYMPDMGIIIQEMVEPLYAGVAFTYKEEDCMVEYVEGLGDMLVSGNAEPLRYSTENVYDALNHKIEKHMLNQLIETILDLKKTTGHSIDVEWALDKKKELYLLQLRPVTKELVETSNEPVYLIASLYLDSKLPLNLDLGECTSIYASYVQKRSYTYQLAEKLGSNTGKGYVIHFNGKGLIASVKEFNHLLDKSASNTFVLDVNENIRQVILTKDEVFSYLLNTYSLSPNSVERHTVILREFIQGEFGFISKCFGKQGLLIEYSYDGLLAINRGMADCHRLYFSNGGGTPDTTTNEAARSIVAVYKSINDLTVEMNRGYGGCQLEWVMYLGNPYYVDYSRESTQVTIEGREDSLAIVGGTVRGPALSLMQEKELLSKLSVGPAVSINKSEDLAYHTDLKKIFGTLKSFETKPIIFVDKPYAVLSIFFDMAAGFVFKEGSLLCHLSVLLRENNIPSLICPNFEVMTGTELLISNQQLLVLTAAEESGASS